MAMETLPEPQYPGDEFQHIGVNHEQQASYNQKRSVKEIENDLNKSADKTNKQNDLEER